MIVTLCLEKVKQRCPRNPVVMLAILSLPAAGVRAGSGGRDQHLNIAKLRTLSIDSDHPDLSGDLTDLLVSCNLSSAPYNEKVCFVGFRDRMLRHGRALLSRSTLMLQQVARSVVGNLRTVF